MALASLFDRADNSLKEFKRLVPQVNSHFSFDPGLTRCIAISLGRHPGHQLVSPKNACSVPVGCGRFRPRRTGSS